MQRAGIGFVALLLCGASLATTTSAAQLDVTLYNLPPNLTPINNEAVTILVSQPLFTSDGQVVRDSNDRIRNGDPILLDDLMPRPDGHFVINIPARPGQTRQLVNIQFSRRGKTVTQVLSGIVLEEGRPYHLDVTVPQPLPMAPQPPTGSYSDLYYYYVQPCYIVPGRHRRWFHR